MKNKLKIYASEARVLQELSSSPRGLNTNEVADKAGVSWITADKYLKKWKKKGLLDIEKLKYSSIKEKKKLEKDIWVINKKAISGALGETA